MESSIYRQAVERSSIKNNECDIYYEIERNIIMTTTDVSLTKQRIGFSLVLLFISTPSAFGFIVSGYYGLAVAAGVLTIMSLSVFLHFRNILRRFRIAVAIMRLYERDTTNPIEYNSFSSSLINKNDQ